MPREDLDRLDRNNYTRLVDMTVAKYPVVGFEVLEEPNIASRAFCLFRHDIDMLPDDALPIAEIEASRGVRATYMVLLTSEYYNAFDRENAATLRKIRALGHDIGLHFDATWHAITSESELDAALSREAGVLGDLLECSIDCFSFHNTTEFTMNCRAPHYAGLRNAYAGLFQDHVAYVSDSNGMWRFATWRERLAEQPDRIQILTHPEHWQAKTNLAATRIGEILDGRAENGWRSYCALLAHHGRINESEIGDVIAALSGGHCARGDAIVRQWLAGRREGALADLAAAIISSKQALSDAPALAQALSMLASGRRPTEKEASAALHEGACVLASHPDGG